MKASIFLVCIFILVLGQAERSDGTGGRGGDGDLHGLYKIEEVKRLISEGEVCPDHFKCKQYPSAKCAFLCTKIVDVSCGHYEPYFLAPNEDLINVSNCGNDE